MNIQDWLLVGCLVLFTNSLAFAIGRGLGRRDLGALLTGRTRRKP